MKKILFLFMLMPFLALSQKDEKQKLKYDTLTKTLTRERTIVVTEIIDTARINSEIFRLEADAAGLNVRIDSLRAQQKEETAERQKRQRQQPCGGHATCARRCPDNHKA